VWILRRSDEFEFDGFSNQVIVLFDYDALVQMLRKWLCLTGLRRHSYLGCSRLAGCVHSSVNKSGASGRVIYNTLTHARLYCRDSEKK